MFKRQKIAMMLAEFIGVALLVLVVYSMVARTAFPLFSGIAAGATAGIMVLVLSAFSGAHLNPAVTVGQWTLKKIGTLDAVLYIVAQFLGGLAAWALLQYFLGREISNTASDFTWKIFVSEMIGAAVFVFGVTSATLQQLDKPKFAAVVGVSLFLGILAASLASNAIINPAIAVGVRSWNWAYGLGPIAGGVVGANLYAIMAGASDSLIVSAGTRVKKSSKSKKSSSKKK